MSKWASSLSVELFKPNILTPETAAFHHLVFADFPKVSSVFMKSHRRVPLSANGMIEHQTWQMCHTLKHYWHTVRGQKNRSVNVLSAAQGEMFNVWIYALNMDLANSCTVCYGLHFLTYYSCVYNQISTNVRGVINDLWGEFVTVDNKERVDAPKHSVSLLISIDSLTVWSRRALPIFIISLFISFSNLQMKMECRERKLSVWSVTAIGS